MTRTALAATWTKDGTRFAEYCGAETAVSFGDAAQEFQSLMKGCAVYDLGWRVKILIKGADRDRWMNGMVTNNVRDLPKDHGVYSFFLNPQGQIQADLYVYQLGEYLIVDTDQSQKQRLLELFDKFIIMDDVTVEDADVQMTAIGIQGPFSAEVMAKLGIDAASMEPLQIRHMKSDAGEASLIRSDWAESAFELWASSDVLRSVWESLTDAGAKPVGTEALEAARMIAGRPRFGLEIRERDLPQEANQPRALHFKKGCYVGQEIVERVHSRGNVHKQLTGLVLEKAVEPGTKVLSDGKEVGEVRSAVKIPLPGNSQTLAMAMLRREGGDARQVQTADGTTATVVRFPFKME